MRQTLFTAAIAALLPLFAACTKSVERAERDVDRARMNAAENVRQEQRELQETRQDAAARVARQEQRVEDAARQGDEQVREEQQDLREARREERRERDNATRIDGRPVPPATQPLPPDGAARIDVDVNRTPGKGVNVNVDRTP